jgi:hypothetical protein
MCSPEPIEGEPTLWQLREHFDTKVSHELDLIGHRMTWLVTSQAFLFAGWVTVASNEPKLALVIAIVGLSVSLVAFLGIGAALRVLDRMGSLYLAAVEAALCLPEMGSRRADAWTIKFGNWPAVVIPPVFAGVWAGAICRAAIWFSLDHDDRIAAAIAIAIILMGCASTRYLLWKPGINPTKSVQMTRRLQEALDEHSKTFKAEPRKSSGSSSSSAP